MNVDDIDGASPRICRNLPHSQRHTNPLNPEYQLPTKKEDPPPEPKFVYDGFNFDDIPGVHPKSYKPTKPARHHEADDIDGARPKYKNRRFDHSNRILDVSDINTDGVFKTKRRTNPVTPEALFRRLCLENDFGVSHTNYLSRNGKKDFSLTIDEINGASADSSTQWYRNFRRPQRDNADDDSLRANIVNSSCNGKREAILERKRAIDNMRGERIRKFERRQHELDISQRKKRSFNETFSVSPNKKR